MTQLVHAGRVVERSIDIATTPEAAWNAWADPEALSRWFCDRAEGVARIGQTQTWHFDLSGAHFSLPVLDVARGERLAWGGDLEGRGPFLQEVRIAREGALTRVTVRNSGFAEDGLGQAQAAGVDSGWALALATLKRFLERYPRESRTHLMVLESARTSLQAVQPSFESAQGLSRWLATEADLSEEPLRVGARVALVLADGGKLSGEVLVRTPFEVLLSWEEENGVLALKAFQRTPDEISVGLDFNAWPLASAFPRLHELLDTSAGRLARALGRAARAPTS